MVKALTVGLLILCGTAQAWFPNLEELKDLCCSSRWEEEIMPLLEEKDEAILLWLQTPMGFWQDTPLGVCAKCGNPCQRSSLQPDRSNQQQFFSYNPAFFNFE